MTKLRIIVSALDGHGSRRDAEVLAAFIARAIDPLTRNAILTTSKDIPRCGSDLALMFPDVEIAVV